MIEEYVEGRRDGAAVPGFRAQVGTEAVDALKVLRPVHGQGAGNATILELRYLGEWAAPGTARPVVEARPRLGAESKEPSERHEVFPSVINLLSDNGRVL